MQTQTRANQRVQGQAYRAFSRQRYSQLKKELKHLRESEIVARVIREWEHMNQDQKNKFGQGNDVLLNLNPMSTPLKDKMAPANQKTTVEKKQEKSEHSSVNLDDINVREFQESEPSKLNKTKKISKPSSDYASFFKHHFKKLRNEHSRWNSRQITNVIGLLWKKLKLSLKGSKTRTSRLTRVLSGRRFFRKIMGLDAQETKRRWTQMPQEGRRHWQRRGDSQALQKTPLEAKGTMRFASSNSTHNMDFMRSKMM